MNKPKYKYININSKGGSFLQDKKSNEYSLRLNYVDSYNNYHVYSNKILDSFLECTFLGTSCCSIKFGTSNVVYMSDSYFSKRIRDEPLLMISKVEFISELSKHIRAMKSGELDAPRFDDIL